MPDSNGSLVDQVISEAAAMSVDEPKMATGSSKRKAEDTLPDMNKRPKNGENLNYIVGPFANTAYWIDEPQPLKRYVVLT
jgi:hypothetical protein